MNIYRKTFVAACPNDGEAIIYDLKIETDRTIYVEHINTATALIKAGFQEEIADELHQRFGGLQTIQATHQGVDLTSIWGGP
ncbi:hypothetical protein [Pseudomonas oryzihabitans]|uniref:Uncharacterized protein n=1 Tax=Pseudomonas oryzihabitans TaxID=47885 RepID=A0ABX3IQS5_9PSED|nr:hypothetical protein [Pseudomonas psychrotolerans]ONN70701.1 hypothetical protein BVL52_20935 [Pseudomonas psychrotolerans]